MISKIAARRLREIYLDQNVTLYLRDMNIVTASEDGQEVKISPMLDGYVINIDQDYFYLGSQDGSVFKTVPHSVIGPIELTFAGGELMDADMVGSDEDVH